MINNKPLTIGIDVDQTINNISEDWLRYLLQNYPLKSDCAYPVLTNREVLPYNLSEMFEVGGCRGDGFEFWHSDALYDTIGIRNDALRVIPLLKEMGHSVVFVSTCIGNHSASKANYINKHFLCEKAIVFTDQKQLVKVDVLIDDCFHNLNKLDDSVLGVKFRMDFKEQCKPNKTFKTVYNWDEVYDMFNLHT